MPAHEVAAEFNLNIAGLSLPYDLYDGYKDNLQFTTRNTSVCGNDTDSFCYLTSTCGTYYDFFNEFNFKLAFADQDNYLRVPLSMFQEDYLDGECKLNIFRNPSEEPKIILGSSFFYGFYGEFKIDYNNRTAPVQSLKLYENYASQNSYAYVGNQTLRTGKNPFQPYKIPPAMTIGLLVAAAVLVAFLMGLMVWGIRRQVKQNERASIDPLIYNLSASEREALDI